MEKELKELVELSRLQVALSESMLEEMKAMSKTMREIRIRLVDKLPD